VVDVTHENVGFDIAGENRNRLGSTIIHDPTLSWATKVL
jgi:hypothetical protein